MTSSSISAGCVSVTAWPLKAYPGNRIVRVVTDDPGTLDGL
jgi:hypothetical protein